MKHKRNDSMCDPWNSQWDEKMQFLFLLLFAMPFWSEMKIQLLRMQNKKPFEIILHVGQVTSLQSWMDKNHVTVKPLQMNGLFLTTLPTLTACNSPYMQYYFKRFIHETIQNIDWMIASFASSSCLRSHFVISIMFSMQRIIAAFFSGIF